MKQLKAYSIIWPLWTAYLIEQEEWISKMYFSKHELLQRYSTTLLDILETKWYYESPKQPKNQLTLDFNK